MVIGVAVPSGFDRRRRDVLALVNDIETERREGP
jgi:hypothetical protein